MRKRLSLALLSLFVSIPLFAQNYSAKSIVKKLDELYRSESSYAEMEMDITTPHWQRTLRMKAWTKGADKTFIRITDPKKEAGTATLRIGNEMWNYLPHTNKVLKVPPSMMMGSWMGSDFTNDDLVKEFSLADDYTYQLIHPDSANPDYLYLQAIPKEGVPVVWGKQISTVRKSDYLPVREEFFDEKGQLMRVLIFRDIREFSGRKIPAVMEMIPKTKSGHKTVIRYNNLQLNINVPEEIFSLRNLRSH